MLNMLDEGNREGLAIEVGTSIPMPRDGTRMSGPVVALVQGVPGQLPAARQRRWMFLTAQVFVDWNGIVIYDVLTDPAGLCPLRCACIELGFGAGLTARRYHWWPIRSMSNAGSPAARRCVARHLQRFSTCPTTFLIGFLLLLHRGQFRHRVTPRSQPREPREELTWRGSLRHAQFCGAER